jgi:hypothetical protein
MNHLIVALTTTAPDPDTVTPGPIGFLTFFLVAVAVILLGFDMVRRIRRTTYRAEIQQRLKDEVAERDAAADQGNPDRRNDTDDRGNPTRPE